jgi:hypothetical protein
MVIKGKARANGAQLGEYLVTPGKNERVEVVEVRGTCAPDVRGAVREMDAVSLCTRCRAPLYHASINTQKSERLTPEQRTIAVDRLERELGFTGQPRVVVVHEKAGREHTHIVWSRTDIQHQRAIRIDHNFRRHELVARELEREFGHARIQGAHIEREGRARPARTPSQAELQQAERTGLKPQEVKEHITEIWQRTDNGRAFAAAVRESGYAIAPGDRRDFVVIDLRGGVHSLARCVEGANAKEIRARMADLDPRLLPTIPQAKEMMKERLGKEAEPTKEQTKPFERNAGAGRSGQPGAAGAARAADAVAGAAGQVIEGMASLFEGLFGGASAPKPATPHEIAAAEYRAAEAEKEAKHDAIAHQSEDDLTKRREALKREFGRELEETLRNELEQGVGRERTRRE